MQQLLRYRGKNFTLNDVADESFQKISTDQREAQKLVDRNWPVCPIHRFLGVAVSSIMHQEQDWNGKMVLRPIAYGCKVLNDTEMENEHQEWRCLPS